MTGAENDDQEKPSEIIKKNPEKFEELLRLLNDVDPTIKDALKTFKKEGSTGLRTVKVIQKDIEENYLKKWYASYRNVLNFCTPLVDMAHSLTYLSLKNDLPSQ